MVMVLPITALTTTIFLGVIFATSDAGIIDFKKFLNASESASDSDAGEIDEFAAVMDKFKFQLSNASDVRRRLGNFRKAKQNIAKLGARFKKAKFGVNKFSLMSTEEKQQFLGAEIPDESPSTHETREKRSAPDDLVSTAIPEEYDFRAVGKVTPVKNQKQCGSCWAFASAAMVESQYLLRYNQTLDLSEQNLVSCYTSTRQCKGADPIYALNYIQKNGITTESCQPYLAKSDECRVECENQKYYINGYRNFGKDESTYAAQLYNYGPASVIIYVPEAFMSYKSGILDFPSAECKLNKIGKHGMLIVGYTADYWIFKNSWGPDWGENGYVRVKRGQNFCAMTIQVAAPYLNVTDRASKTTTAKVVNPPKPTQASTPRPPSMTDGCSEGDGKSTMNAELRAKVLNVFNGKRSELAKGKFVMKNGMTAPAAQNMKKLRYNCSLETSTLNYISTCYNGAIFNNTYTNTLAFESVLPIAKAISQAPQWLFSFTVSQQGLGTSMFVTDGDAAFANSDAIEIGCAYTNTPCSQMSHPTIFACTISPSFDPFPSSTTPLYTMGNGCTSNAQCTKPGYNKCDTALKLCYA